MELYIIINTINIRNDQEKQLKANCAQLISTCIYVHSLYLTIHFIGICISLYSFAYLCAHFTLSFNQTNLGLRKVYFCQMSFRNLKLKHITNEEQLMKSPSMYQGGALKKFIEDIWLEFESM